MQDTKKMKNYYAQHSQHNDGFTLIELMIVISIVGLLIAVATPGMRAYLSNSSANSMGNTLLIDIMYTRNHAITNELAVFMLPLDNTTGASTYTPASKGVNWGLGWIIGVDADSNGSFDAGEPIIRRQASFGPDAHISSGPGAHITSGVVSVLDRTNPIGFDNRGFPLNTGVLSIATNGCAGPNGQYIQINQIGQVISRSGQCPAAFTNL